MVWLLAGMQAASAALRQVQAKVDDYFTRCRLAAFDARAHHQAGEALALQFPVNGAAHHAAVAGDKNLCVTINWHGRKVGGRPVSGKRQASSPRQLFCGHGVGITGVSTDWTPGRVRVAL